MASKRRLPIRRPGTPAQDVSREPVVTQTESGETRKAPQELPAVIQDDATVALAPTTELQAARGRFPIVGIGASAGGLEALQELFSHMPSDSGMAFVVVTHQHPGYVSLLPSLLSKSTSIPVVEAHDGLLVEPNHIYVGLPGGLLGISGGVLHRLDGESVRAPHLPIVHFLRSLAVDQREHAIGVVLSGTGSDGTLGVRAIKAESGMVMVQEPPSAKYAGMPASAAATGLADYVLPTAAMPSQLITYTRGPYLKIRPLATESPLFPREPLQQILGLLQVRTGHDFTRYKTTTILRRIERRMNVHQIKEPAAYVRYLRENPHELDVLFGELLISVTGFFRDPQAFEVLAEKALPNLLSARFDGQAFRVWIPGCASGEEAYSVAILLRENLERAKRMLEVQIFGTDLDAHAIEAARAGIYPAGITADVSKERLDRFFTADENVYRIRKEVREMLVFAPQNVIKDPPFTKLDLIVCRNLLIYLDAEMQRRLLPVFHYALRPGGVLFLGPSESVGSFVNLFEPLDSKWKIFRRRETFGPVHPLMEFPRQSADKPLPEVLPQGPVVGGKQANTTTHVERLLLSRFAPTCLIVDERGNIVYIHGRTGAFLEPTEGQPRHNVVEMARHGLASPMASAIRQAVKEKTEIVRQNIRVKTNGDYTQVTLTVTNIAEPEPIRGLLLVTIQPGAAVPSPAKRLREKRTVEQPGRVAELEQELQYVKESLQMTIEELETSNEELKSTNEELQSTNEELQSSNEELETSKEEMQSLNEELNTVNAELQAKVEELSHATDDMQNLLNSTQVATIFLDSQLNVKRYTEPARQLFNLIQTDIGRPLSHLTCNIEYDHLIDDCQQVLQTLVPKEAEVCSHQGNWYLVRAMPYRTAENVIDGVVVTFVDIARLKVAEQKASEVWDCLGEIVQADRYPMIVLDKQLRIALANRAFCQTAESSLEHLLGRRFFEVGDGLWNIAPVRNVLDDVLQHDTPVEDCEVRRPGPDGQRVWLLNARRLKGGPEGGRMIVLSLVDQTPAGKS